jgi:hypothetical protein
LTYRVFIGKRNWSMNWWRAGLTPKEWEDEWILQLQKQDTASSILSHGFAIEMFFFYYFVFIFFHRIFVFFSHFFNYQNFGNLKMNMIFSGFN